VQALQARRIVLVNDEVRGNAWEQELYALGVPSSLSVEFASVEEAAQCLPEWNADRTRTILLVADVETMTRLCECTDAITKINVGGLHDERGRSQRLSYVYLSESEAAELRRLKKEGIDVTAQDVPTGRAVPVESWT
jgi:mannose/fructose/N-acetylgalactosamine-specific phosphotransferase system component IIB